MTKPTTRKKQENLNGNFGAARIKANPGELDLTKEILSKDNLRIPDPDKSFTLLIQAYNTTDDARLKAGLWEILRERKATLQQREVKPLEKPVSEFAEYCRRVR
jgi:hypothetical protein